MNVVINGDIKIVKHGLKEVVECGKKIGVYIMISILIKIFTGKSHRCINCESEFITYKNKCPNCGFGVVISEKF